jgi:hypothetical protein
MNITVEHMQGRMNMIKRLNNFILSSIKRIRLRPVGAVILGGFAGLSFNSTILPTVMSSFGVVDEFSARWELGGFAVYTIMVWSVGGWAARKTANPMAGGVILGLVGLVSGSLLTEAAIGSDLKLLAIGGVAGLLYGAIGGMMISSALCDRDDSIKGTTSHGKSYNTTHLPATGSRTCSTDKKEGLRFFRYFK